MQTEKKKYYVEFTEAALRDLKRLPKKAQNQIIIQANGLTENSHPEGVEFLVKFKPLRRIRTGNYRIVYSVNEDDSLVIVAAIGNRKDIYKILEHRT